MSILPDIEIERLSRLTERERFVDGKRGLIEPYEDRQLQPASYDVLLAGEILVPTAHGAQVIINNAAANNELRTVDLSKPIPSDLYRRLDITAGYTLFPGQFVLAATIERVSIPDDMVGRIEGKSSIGRLGITAHITAGYLDPGFRGFITLEIANFFTRPVRLWPGIPIAQLSFEWMSSKCRKPYGSPSLCSRYQDAEGVEPTRYGANSD